MHFPQLIRCLAQRFCYGVPEEEVLEDLQSQGFTPEDSFLLLRAAKLYASWM